ncbi:MAG: hypothetical protein ACHQM6_06045 [Candidatus Kapaibacterium sp.]
MKKRAPTIFFGVFFIITLLFSFAGKNSYCQRPKRPHHHHILDSLAAIIYPSLTYPRNPGSGEIVWGLDLNVAIAPRQVVRDEVRQLPQLNALLRIGLPAGFGIGIKLAGNYIANQFSLAPSWSYSAGHFSAAIQNSSSLWLGTADFTGFNTLGMGFSNAPGINLGMHFDDFLLSTKVELITNYWHYTKFGPDVVKRTVTEFEGEAFTFSIEQDAFGGSRINWGMKLNYTRPDYQLWLAFSDSRQRILIPEFFFGMIL